MPVKAIILTHEKTNIKEFDLYLVQKLAPLRPILFYGRAATLNPVAKSKYAVFDWWKEFHSYLF